MTERKVYTEEFKREAVRLAKERANLAQTARDLGISDTTGTQSGACRPRHGAHGQAANSRTALSQ